MKESVAPIGRLQKQPSPQPSPRPHRRPEILQTEQEQIKEKEAHWRMQGDQEAHQIVQKAKQKAKERKKVREKRMLKVLEKGGKIGEGAMEYWTCGRPWQQNMGQRKESKRPVRMSIHIYSAQPQLQGADRQDPRSTIPQWSRIAGTRTGECGSATQFVPNGVVTGRCFGRAKRY